MVSSDFRVVINGQVFRVEGEVLKPAEQTSFQQEVLRRLDGIESRLGAVELEQKSMRSELRTMHDEQLVLQTRVDILIWGGGIAFSLLCAVIAWTSLFAPRFWNSRIDAESKPQPSQPDTQSLANSIIDAFTKGVTLGRNERE